MRDSKHQDLVGRGTKDAPWKPIADLISTARIAYDKRTRKKRRRKIQRMHSTLESLEPRIVLSNNPPIAVEDYLSPAAQVGRPHVWPAPGILANDSDPDGDSLEVYNPGSIEVFKDGDPDPVGYFVVNADGSVEVTMADPGSEGGYHFYYQVTDGQAVSPPAQAQVSLGIEGTPLSFDFLEATTCISCGCSCEGAADNVNLATGSQTIVLPREELMFVSGGLGTDIIAVDVPWSTFTEEPSSIEARLFIDSDYYGRINYTVVDYNSSESTRIAFETDLSSLPSDIYNIDVLLFPQYPTSEGHVWVAGTKVVVNLRDLDNPGTDDDQRHPFGIGWLHRSLEQLVQVDSDRDDDRDDYLWIQGDGNYQVFDHLGGGYYQLSAYHHTDLNHNELSQVSGGMMLTDKYGNKRTFLDRWISEFQDRNGNLTSYTYDSEGAILQIDYPGSRSYTFGYTGNQVTSITDFAGRVTTLGYTGDKLTSVNRPATPAGTPTYTFGYTNDNLSSLTDPEGNTTNYSWSNGVLTTTYPNSATTTLELPRYKGLVTGDYMQSGGLNANTFRTLDVEGTFTDEVGGTSTFKTDKWGLLTEWTDPLDHTWIYSRDVYGALVSVQEPDPDGAGPLVGRMDSYYFDSKHNLTQLSLAGGETQRSWTYDMTFSQPLSFTNEYGATTNYTLDANGNVLEANTMIGMPDDPYNGEQNDIVHSYTYTTGPIAGLVATHTDPLQLLTSFSRDSSGRITQVIEGGVTVQQFSYNAADMPLTSTDALGNVTSFTWDDMDHLLTVTGADPDDAGPLAAPVWSYSYDLLGRKRTETDPLGRTDTFTYDAMGNLVQWDQPPTAAGATTTTWSYDAASRLVSMTDPLNRTISYTYNPQHHLVTVTLPDPDDAGPLSAPVTTFTRDAIGRVTSRTDALGNVTDYSYNQPGYQVTETLPELYVGANRATITTDYDPAGQVSDVSLPLGRVIQFTRDSVGRLTAEARGTYASLATETFDYDQASNLRFHRDAANSETEYVYDARYRLASLILPDPVSGDSTGPTYSYTYDAAGRQLTETDPLGHVTSFTYDNLHRLSQVTSPTPGGGSPLGPRIVNYNYDATGNLIEVDVDDPDGVGPLSQVVTSYQYDSLDRLTSVTLPDPGDGIRPVHQWQWDAAGQLSAATDPLGNVTSHQYDNLGRMTRTDLPGTPSTYVSFEYDAVGNLLAETLSGMLATSYAYDNMYRLTSRTDPDPDGLSPGGPDPAPVTQYSYDLLGQLLTETDPLMRVTSFTYDAQGRVDQVTLPTVTAGTPMYDYDYNAVGDLTKITDPNGGVTDFQYDKLRRQTSVTQPMGSAGRPQTQFEYDAEGRLTRSVDPLGRDTLLTYDALDRIITQAQPAPTSGPYAGQRPTTSFSYDLLDNLISTTDAMGRVTDLEYDGLSRLVKRTDPDPDGAGPQTSPETTWNYDVASQLLSSTDPLGRTTSYQYDGQGRVTQVTRPAAGEGPYAAVQPVVSFQYDAFNRLASRTDPNGHTTDFIYDNLSRLTDVYEPDPDGAGPLAPPVSSFGYDVASQLISRTDPLGNVTALEYDALGRNTRITEPAPGGGAASPFTLRSFDLVGNLLYTEDALGNRTSFAYGLLNQVTSKTDPNLDVTNYTYDVKGNRLSLTDASSNTTSWTWDELDRVIQETNQLGKSRHFEYDQVDNLTKRTDRTGAVIEYDFDDLDRLTAERWLDAQGATIHTISLGYDAASQLTSGSDAFASYTWHFDQLGQATQITGTFSAVAGQTYDPQFRLSQSFDLNGNRIGLSAEIYDHLAATPDWELDFQNSYTFDALNRMTRIDQQGQAGGAGVAEKRVELAYDAAGQLQSLDRYADVAGTQLVVTSDYTFDGAGRLTDLTHRQGGTTLADYDWTFDAASRVTQFTSSADGTVTYTYDPRDQLTGADYDYQSDETYAYDSTGNRSTNTVGANNQTTSDGQYNYTYDDEGRRTRRTEIAGGAWTDYDWDHRSRLVKVTIRDSAGGAQTVVEYVYDLLDRKIARAETDVATGATQVEYYVHDGEHIALRLDEDGQVQNRYLHGPMVDMVLADEQVATAGSASSVLWTLGDNLGTIRDLASYDSGTGTTTVINHRTFDAFGNQTSETNAAVDHLFGYTGRDFDEVTGLQNNRARWYDPDLAQWLSEDPIGFAANDENLRRYVGNAATLATDPSGLDSWIDIHALARQREDTYRAHQQVWNNIERKARSLQVPTGLIRFARSKSPIFWLYFYGNDPPSINYYGDICLSPSDFASLRQRVTWTDFDELYNEFFHVWMREHVYKNGEPGESSEWIVRLMQAEGYSELELPEEAMSEWMAEIAWQVAEYGFSNQMADAGSEYFSCRRRSLELNRDITPAHKEGKWKDNAEADVPISDTLLILTIWIFENGDIDPASVYPGIDRERALRKWYDSRWSPDRPVESRVDRLGRPWQE